MCSKKTYILIVLLSIIVILSGCGGNARPAERAVENLLSQIERGNINDISLTIYYSNPISFTPVRSNVRDLVNRDYEYRLVIDGVHLEEYIDVIKRLGDIELIPIERRSSINARIYYVFERNNRRILDVGMWGEGGSVFVNGVEVERKDIFIDIIIPFLSEEKASLLGR